MSVVLWLLGPTCGSSVVLGVVDTLTIAADLNLAHLPLGCQHVTYNTSQRTRSVPSAGKVAAIDQASRCVPTGCPVTACATSEALTE